MAALKLGKTGEVYNLGGGVPLANIEITKLLLEFTGNDESMVEKVPDRLGHDRAYLINHSKATEQLKWKPIVNFRSGLQATVQWYKDNKNWVEEAKLRTARMLKKENKNVRKQKR
jgi:dTDP-glucose 4,6-dehydratase